jgi:hypothetical protein
MKESKYENDDDDNDEPKEKKKGGGGFTKPVQLSTGNYIDLIVIIILNILQILVRLLVAMYHYQEQK